METRVATYERVSKESQTILNQTPILIDFASRRGWTISEQYSDEGVSGAKASRPGLDRLMEDIRSGKFDVVIIYKLDRIARSALNFLKLAEELKAHGVTLISVTEGLDPSTPSGKFQSTVFAGLAELERDMIRERTKAGLARTRAQGTRLGRPLGSGIQLDRSQVADLHSQGLSTYQIAERLSVSQSTVSRAIRSAQ